MDERSQFRCLLKGFSFRFLENELTSPEGDPFQTIIHALALLFGFAGALVVAYMYKYPFGLSQAPAALREAISWGDKEFLVSFAMAVTALTCILTWDGLFPDRRDCLTLHALPIRNRVIFAAKLSAALLLFAAVTATPNIPLALCFPYEAQGDAMTTASWAAGAVAHLVAACGASAFAFFSLMGLQGLLVSVLSFRLYKWVSAWIQLGSLFVVLAVFFLTPDVAHPATLSDPANRLLIHLLPPFWFLGLYEKVQGADLPVVNELARIAVAGLAVSVLFALGAYALGYRRYVRKTIEEADALARGTRAPGLLSRLADAVLVRQPIERAVFHFAARTMARSRKHRLLLAIYLAVGLAYTLNSVRWLLEGRTARLYKLDSTISSIPMILAFFMLLGMRILFTIPIELRANWIFRLTENGRRFAYLSGVRKFMTVVGIAPLALGTFPVYGLLWGWWYAARHLLLVTLILLLVLEFLMREFPKIPFTCSFLPGKANLKATISVYVILFALFAYLVSTIELNLLRSQTGYWKGAGILAAVLIYRMWRRYQWERRLNGFVYEEHPEWVLASLNPWA